MATVTFTFESHGGSSVDTIEVEIGQLVTEPTDPIYTGYTFDGWYNDDGTFTDPWDFDTDVAAVNTTLYANWDLIDYTITYLNLLGIAQPNPATYNIETSTITLADPTETTGYSFDGWYVSLSSVDGLTEITQGSTGNVVVYAGWDVIHGFVTIPIYGPGDRVVKLNSRAIIDARVTQTVKNNESEWYVHIYTLLGKYYMLRTADAPYATKNEALTARDLFIASIA